ncbi:MAG: hypothetical protein QOE73_1850, partial [Verrucomicrobiota bacterium]
FNGKAVGVNAHVLVTVRNSIARAITAIDSESLRELIFRARNGVMDR